MFNCFLSLFISVQVSDSYVKLYVSLFGSINQWLSVCTITTHMLVVEDLSLNGLCNILSAGNG